MNALQLIGIGALLYWGLKSVSNSVLSGLQLMKIKIYPPNISFDGATFNLDFSIRNNSSVSLPLEGFSGELLYGQSPLSSISLSDTSVIEAGMTTIVPVSAFIDFQDLALEVVDMITQGDYLNALSVQGTLYSSGVAIPVNMPISLQ